jgi:hypothetical protein
MAIYPSQYAPIPVPDLNNWNTDRDVEPVVMTRGVMYKTGGDWYFWDGQSKSDDAGLFRVSALGVTTTSAPLSCDSSSVSAFQDNATRLRVSAFSNDAGLMRVSALGVTATTAPLSCDGSSVSAFQDIANRLRVSAFSNDAGLLHVSAIGTMTVSAHEVKQSDAASLRVSVIGTSSIGEGTAFIGQVSAILKDNPTNATYLGHVSSYSTAANQAVSAAQSDAVNLNVSAKSGDAGTLRTSAYLPVDTVGQMSVFRSLSLSASQAIKATAGAVYGYYLFNTTTVPQYVKLTNTSGAIAVGTDTPIATFMLPASAAANVWFGQGLKGFTAGIGIHATSAVADNATTPAAASAVGGNIFYN